ncbi:MAG: hypothetical protein E7546_07665 [Ruminococcaceae bacterium]|nr:hypothetical protein [Oscillospiraceae bacterium]
MSKNTSNELPKSKKGLTVTLIVILSVAALIAAALAAFSTIYYTEASVDVCWKSGEVTICGENITFPCTVDDFEKQLDTTISESDYSDVIKPVTVSGENGYSTFKVFVYGDWVTGIIVDLCDLSSADDIILPGNVTLDDDLDDIKKKYRTGLLNIYYNEWSEEIAYNLTSSGHRYIDFDSYCVDFGAIEGEIQEVSYYYNPDEFYDRETGTQITIKDEYTN